MPKASPILTAFNAGELSPLMEGRVDMPVYAKGGRVCTNWIPTAQGPLIRRGGLRYIGFTRGPSEISLLLPFRRNNRDAYLLEFKDGRIRFYYDGGLVLDAGLAPYEILTPYTVNSLLYTADGYPAIDTVQSGDVLYAFHGNYPPQKVSFFGVNNWTCAAMPFKNGPWKDGNNDKTVTVYASAISGSITLTASSAIFTVAQIGSLFRLEQADLTAVKPWEPGQKNVFLNTLRRSDGKTYKAVTIGVGTQPPGGTGPAFNSWTQTGSDTPIHTEGRAWDGGTDTEFVPGGTTNFYTKGIEWEFQDAGYGVVRITSIGGGGTTATATVIAQLPFAVLGSGGASWKWEFGAWSDAEGYPTTGAFYKERLCAAVRTRFYASVAGDFENFSDKEFGEVLADSAITQNVLSDQVSNIQWMSPQKVLIIGTGAAEFVCQQQSISDPFGPANISILPHSDYGSRPIKPIRVQSSTVFVEENGASLRQFAYVYTEDAYQSKDLNVFASHIARGGGIVSMAWAKNPDSVIWCALGDGSLISLTLNTENEVSAWGPHPIGQTASGGAQVKQLIALPSVSGDYDEVYAVVLRAGRYHIERIEQPYRVGDNPAFAFTLDGGTTYDGKKPTTLALVPLSADRGATDVPFTAGVATFTADDIGRFIDYWYVDPADPRRERWLRSRAQIDTYVGPQVVRGTIVVPFPFSPSMSVLPADSWRLTVTEISGLGMFETGDTVQVLADGAAHPDCVVEEDVGIGNGIRLQYPASIVQIGYYAPADWQSMQLEAGAADGTAQGKQKRAFRYKLRFVASGGIAAGPSFDELDEIDIRQPFMSMDMPVPLLTGDHVMTPANNYDRDVRVSVRVFRPLPAILVAVMPDIVTND